MRSYVFKNTGIEAIVILCHDGNMRACDLFREIKLPPRTYRSWKSGRESRSTTMRTVERLESALHAHQLVPWSATYLPTALAMWVTVHEAGKRAVLRRLRSQKRVLEMRQRETRDGGELRVAEELLCKSLNDLRTASRRNPLHAQSIYPQLYAEAGATALEESVHAKIVSRELPSPPLLDIDRWSPELWTALRHRIQFYRETQSLRKQSILDNPDYLLCRDRLLLACDRFSTYAWSVILAFHVVEAELAMEWRNCHSVSERRELLHKLSWNQRWRPYQSMVKGNFMAARNALAVASATHDRSQYEDLYKVLVSADSAWCNPVALRDTGRLDSDFADFVDWWLATRSRDPRPLIVHPKGPQRRAHR
ncbi:MAG: hypothetical protein OXU81_09450 [Gammaproteobacteria bacterium]|nr:hypothetical protein [Gammaproteobacteria bacterium]